MNFREFVLVSAAALGGRVTPVAGRQMAARRVVTLVYDKALGARRLVDKAVR